MVKPFCAVFAFAALLGGCESATSASNATYDAVFRAVGVVDPLSAEESRKWDGSYQGRIREVRADGPECTRETGERVLMVTDAVVWYAYTPVTMFTAPIQYDGSINATAGNTTMSGRIKGNDMNLTVKSPNCETTLRMHYIYNHS